MYPVVENGIKRKINKYYTMIEVMFIKIYNNEMGCSFRAMPFFTTGCI